MKFFDFLKTDAPPLTWADVWQSKHPLFYFGKHQRDPFTVEDSYKHIFAVGASGSGKTSGSLALFARTYLQAGYGGLVMCAKREERALWEFYCRQTGRTKDLIVVATDSDMPFRFNFLDYELRRKGRGAGSVTNIVDLFSTIMDIIENNTKEAMSEDVWDRTALDLVRYAVIVLSFCDAPLTIETIEHCILDAPQKHEVNDPHWKSHSFTARRLQEAYRNVKTGRERRDLKAAYDYFMKKHARLAERTRSSIEMTFNSIAGKFRVGDVREMLCTDTTFTPELLWEQGKIIVLDMPVSQFNKEGLLIQGILKHSFQKAMLRRDLNTHPRPIFLAQDEYQNFMSAFDYRFLSEARSAGVSVMMATQNISNMYSVLGGGAQHQANSLLGNAALKIIHANTDTTTNEWASQVIGQQWMQMISTSTKGDGQGTGANLSQQIHARKLPSDFMNLKTGGARNKFQVEAYVIQTGHGKWHSTKNAWHKAWFEQMFGEQKKEESEEEA